jgi:hypothetical protein
MMCSPRRDRGLSMVSDCIGEPRWPSVLILHPTTLFTQGLKMLDRTEAIEVNRDYRIREKPKDSSPLEGSSRY